MTFSELCALSSESGDMTCLWPPRLLWEPWLNAELISSFEQWSQTKHFKKTNPSPLHKTLIPFSVQKKKKKKKNSTGFHPLHGKHQLKKAKWTKNIWISFLQPIHYLLSHIAKAGESASFLWLSCKLEGSEGQHLHGVAPSSLLGAGCEGLLFLGSGCVTSHQNDLPQLELGLQIWARKFVLQGAHEHELRKSLQHCHFSQPNPCWEITHGVLGFSLPSLNFHTVQSQSDACSTQPLSEGGVLGEERGQEESSKHFS